MTRRRRTVLLALVCIFAAVTAVGAFGITLGTVAVGVTAFIATGATPKARWWRALFGVSAGGLVLLTIFSLVWPVVGMTAAGRVYFCKAHLKGIGVAVHNYHQKWGSFPPAYLADEAGQPAHSWRALLIPFMEKNTLFFNEVEAKWLFKPYDFAEPWNGANNSQLLSRSFYDRHDRPPSAIYWCPAWPGIDDDGVLITRYFAVVGEHTVWPGAASRSLAEIAVPAQTILVVERFDREVPWLAPVDLGLEEAAVASPYRGNLLVWWLGLIHKGYVGWDPIIGDYHRYMGRHALFADGSVRLLPNDLSAADFRALADIRDVPKPVLPPPPPDREAIPELLRRLPFPAVAIRWAGGVLFLIALAAMARSAAPPPAGAKKTDASHAANQAS